MGVTNIWHVMNLTSTPFFQDPLVPGENAQHPINLFVGREKEARYILDGIGSSQHSRHVIQGAVGVGKTTLLQYVKAEAAKAGYLVDADAVAVTSAATADELRLRILMRKIALRGLDASSTARQMEKPFGLKYTATNSALGDLVAKGYLEEAGGGPRGGAQGGPSRRFRLTGAGRIALGGFRSNLEPDGIG
jgi:hypothetical protein